MADTAYERFLKDVKDDKAIEVEVRDPKPLDLDQIKLKIQEELSTQTEPKKPVKWLAMPDPKNIMSLYYQLNPTKRARLPNEITDDIVELMSNSAEALEDFAMISSQQEVDQFNKKYSVNLVLPGA